MAARKTPAKKTGTTKKAAPKRQPAASREKFVRNLTGTEFRIRLTRQVHPERPFVLQPRGQRGDIAPLKKEDLQDPILLDNLALGVIELITAAEAKAAIEKQGINLQAPHPALNALRNELGEEYPEGALKTEPAFEEQGITVAHLEDGQVAFDHQGIANRDPGLTDPNATKESPIRNTSINPAEVPVEGIAGSTADSVARQKGAEGPAAGLGGIKKVTLEPTKKVD